MHWNLRMKAAERGIWKAVELRRMLAEAGLDVSAGKMSMLWTTTPTTIRLDDLDVICTVLSCTPADLLVVDADAAAARRPEIAQSGTEDTPPRPASSKVTPRLGRNRTLPPA
jgi:DNA-binding Xre family transcriptional regulator